MTLMIKDPEARIDVSVDWGARYLDGQVVAASTWTVDPIAPDGIAIAAHSFDLVRTAATLTGGVAGASYRVTNRATLSDGQIDERSFQIRVEQQ
jgi:hypothetical protein